MGKRPVVKSHRPPWLAPGFGDRLRHLLRERGAQTALAGRLGIEPRTVTRWVKEQSFPKSQREVGRIALALGVPIERLTAQIPVNLLNPPAPASGVGPAIERLVEARRLVNEALGLLGHHSE